MPIGPNGEKRPPDVITNAVHVMKIATGEIEEVYAKPQKRKRRSVPAQDASEPKRQGKGSQPATDPATA